MSHLHAARVGVSLFVCCLSVIAQDVISVKAGLVHYIEGDVFVDGQKVVMHKGDFTQMKAGQVLNTRDALAEVLLTPGTILRLADNSSFKLVNDQLEQVEIELLTGSMLLETAEMAKGTSLSVKAAGYSAEVSKRGLIRVDTDPARIRVYEGNVALTGEGQTLKLKGGKETLLTGVLAPEKFNKKEANAFVRWASRRSALLARANHVGAQSFNTGNSGVLRMSGWWYNPYFGMFTYFPQSGMYSNAFGYTFYSPTGYYNYVYAPRPETGWNGNSGIGSNAGRGYDSGRNSSGTYSAPVSSAPSQSVYSAPAAAAGGSRGADSGGGSRGDGSGRR